MNSYTPYVGLGLGLLQTQRFHFGTNLTAGADIFAGHTYRGLANDVFKASGYLSLRIEATVFP